MLNAASLRRSSKFQGCIFTKLNLRDTLASGPPPAFIVRQGEFYDLAARSELASSVPLDAVEKRVDSMHAMYMDYAKKRRKWG